MTDNDQYDEIIDQAVREYKRKVFIKKLLLLFAVVFIIGGIVYGSNSNKAAAQPKQQVVSEIH